MMQMYCDIKFYNRLEHPASERIFIEREFFFILKWVFFFLHEQHIICDNLYFCVIMEFQVQHLNI